MNFELKIDDLEIHWVFDRATVYNNAFHSDIVKEYFYSVWAVHKHDPEEPHTGHSGPVIFDENKDRIKDFIEFGDLTHEDLVRWTKRNIDTKELYDTLLDQMRYEMVYRNKKLPFVKDADVENEAGEAKRAY